MSSHGENEGTGNETGENIMATSVYLEIEIEDYISVYVPSTSRTELRDSRKRGFNGIRFWRVTGLDSFV